MPDTEGLADGLTDGLTDGEVTYWTVILVLGAVVIVAVVVLLSVLVARIRRIDAGVAAIAGTLTAITENTADARLVPATGDGLDLVLAEGLQHHLFLGRAAGSPAGPAIDTAGSLAGPAISTAGSPAGPAIDTAGSPAGPAISTAGSA